MVRQHGIQMKRDKRPKTFNKSVEHVVGKDEEDSDSDSDSESTGNSSSNESTCPDYSESDSSSTDGSSCSSKSSHNKKVPKPRPSLMCAACGRGPFRSIRVHLLHCRGAPERFKCVLCKKDFPTEKLLKEHHMLLFSCDVCGQVFSQEPLFRGHPCPKGNASPLVLYCSEAMPKVCNICKSFFFSEKLLLAHVTRTHASVVKTKVCTIADPSKLNDQKILPGVHRTVIQSSTSGSNIVGQSFNGNLNIRQTLSGSLSRPPPHSDTLLPVPVCKSPTGAVRFGEGDVPFPPLSQSSKCVSPPVSKSHTNRDGTLATAVSDSDSPSLPSVQVLFESSSRDVGLIKRMNTNWRSKATYPCRECGAILRQPSLIISHRYLHRGRRLHQCHCGRAFKHRLHLLRHCLQHAEAASYICVSCGDTFTGAKLLAQHLKGQSPKQSHSGGTWRSEVKKKCRMPFTCDCGQLFFRPSAYIWHQLKNRTHN